MYLRENLLGKYEVYLNTYKKQERKTTWMKLEGAHDLPKAVTRADDKIRNEFSDRFGLIKRSAPWRAQDPTEKQLAMLKRMKVNQNVLGQLNKGQASFLLDKMFEQKPKKVLTPKQKAYLKWKGKF